jgi:hypothetical protein
MSNPHSFHIPVLGIGFSLDTPLKVAHLGIDSVVSLCDDILLERMRKMYCGLNNRNYTEIKSNFKDYRAERITAYLDLINNLIDEKFQQMKTAASSSADEIRKYFRMLPDHSKLKQDFKSMSLQSTTFQDMKQWLHDNLKRGSLDVNIMTKVDKVNFFEDQRLPIEYNDGHAALRGFANSSVNGSVVFSAGMSPRLYSFLSRFNDFFPELNGEIKKRVILKVSDFRSAVIQGKFLAKKGIWVSEYRIESGLNCGGHAFATQGQLLGPILDEFKKKRKELTEENHLILVKALEQLNRTVPSKPLNVKVTVQGGVGTNGEHSFLMEYYKVDAVGWGTPFLLVPEATNVDEKTLKSLESATEKELYLSGISPLGVPLNNLRGNSKDQEKESFIAKGRPGSSCPKKFLPFNTEFTEKGICTASRQYQNLKLQELDSKELAEVEHKIHYQNIVEKACICVGLGTSALLVNGLDTRKEKEGVAICPGPNMAYFNKRMSLVEITDHIYGRTDVINRQNRPNLFIKELSLYLDYLKKQLDGITRETLKAQTKYLHSFILNMNHCMTYYLQLFQSQNCDSIGIKDSNLLELNQCQMRLSTLEYQFEHILNPN